jgi:parallel beta-helix repeat protein
VSGVYGDHIRLQDLEVRNGAASGILPHGDFWEFINLNVHNNGSSGQDHGLYWTGQGGLIDGGSYHDNSGYGIHIYDSGSSSVRNNTVRNVRVYNNNLQQGASALTGVGAGGLVMANGANNTVYNSLFYHNGASSIQINGSCVGCSAYNNTVFGGFTGIQIVDLAPGAVVRNNISFGNVGSAISDAGTGTVLSNNLTTDPKFTNAAAHDFTLQPSSGAINAGSDLSSIFTTDLTGKPRPIGGAFDIGAFEFGAASFSDPVLPTVSISTSH